MESPFRQPVPENLKVIETFGFLTEKGFVRLEGHLSRLAGTCETLGISCDLDVCLQKLATLPIEQNLRVRLTIDISGEVDVTSADMTPTSEIWRIAVCETRLYSADQWLRVKTTNRALYDRARAGLKSEVDELIFLNEKGEVCEGTITNIFADFGDELVTPQTSCVLLPGILRAELLEAGARQKVISFTRLTCAKRLFVGNSLRGLIPARLV
ncbi:MAG: aminotransferase class IV family protein [Paracoccaceae bacterium]